MAVPQGVGDPTRRAAGSGWECWWYVGGNLVASLHLSSYLPSRFCCSVIRTPPPSPMCRNGFKGSVFVGSMLITIQGLVISNPHPNDQWAP